LQQQLNSAHFKSTVVSPKRALALKSKKQSTKRASPKMAHRFKQASGAESISHPALKKCAHIHAKVCKKFALGVVKKETARKKKRI